MKRNNVYIMWIPEGEDKENRTESILKTIMGENSPNLGRETDIQIYNTQKIPNRLNPNKATPK